MLQFIEYPKCSTCRKAKATSGLKYRELGLKEKVPHLTAQEAADLLATDGMLIKRPLLVRDNRILQIGYRKAYEELGL